MAPTGKFLENYRSTVAATPAVVGNRVEVSWCCKIWAVLCNSGFWKGGIDVRVGVPGNLCT